MIYSGQCGCLGGHGMGYIPKRLKAIFIKLDFDKVYDYIELPFILAMLQALGFDQFLFELSRLYFWVFWHLSVNQF